MSTSPCLHRVDVKLNPPAYTAEPTASTSVRRLDERCSGSSPHANVAAMRPPWLSLSLNLVRKMSAASWMGCHAGSMSWDAPRLFS
eukprot:2363909-Rhodomonas_salina.1